MRMTSPFLVLSPLLSPSPLIVVDRVSHWTRTQSLAHRLVFSERRAERWLGNGFLKGFARIFSDDLQSSLPQGLSQRDRESSPFQRRTMSCAICISLCHRQPLISVSRFPSHKIKVALKSSIPRSISHNQTGPKALPLPFALLGLPVRCVGAECGDKRRQVRTGPDPVPPLLAAAFRGVPQGACVVTEFRPASPVIRLFFTSLGKRKLLVGIIVSSKLVCEYHYHCIIACDSLFTKRGYVTRDYRMGSGQAGNDSYVGLPGVDFHKMRHRSRDGFASNGVPQDRVEARLVVGRVSRDESDVKYMLDVTVGAHCFVCTDGTV